MFFFYFILLAGEFPEVMNCFHTMAGIHACELHLMWDSLIFTVHSAMLYDMQHSLVLVRVSFLHTFKILHKMCEGQYPLNFVMVPWLNGKWLQEQFGGVRY